MGARLVAMSLACLVSSALMAEPPTPVTGSDKAFTLTVYQVWSSPAPSKDPPPKALEKLLDEIKKRSSGKSFRLEGKPIERKLAAGKTLDLKLPSGYSAKWEVVGNGDVALHQTLLNPKKKRSVQDQEVPRDHLAASHPARQDENKNE